MGIIGGKNDSYRREVEISGGNLRLAEIFQVVILNELIKSVRLIDNQRLTWEMFQFEAIRASLEMPLLALLTNIQHRLSSAKQPGKIVGRKMISSPSSRREGNSRDNLSY